MMGYIITSSAAIIGLCVGSFINVLVLRLDRMKGIMTGRSKCLSCGHALAWFDLIPVISFILLWGRCRYCRARISFQYPLVELTTAVFFLVFVWRYGYLPTWYNLYFLFGLLVFWSLFLFDLKYYILPDKLVFPLAAVSLLVTGVFHPGMLINVLLTGGLLGGVFDIMYVVYAGKGMGFGDVKLAFALGFFFGFPVAPLVIGVAAVVGAVWGLVMIALDKATLKTALPFGSFMAAASIIAIFLYNDIVLLRYFL